ncbi:monocarboxylate transporter 12-like, partial [Tropilaelaps mercedesae]
YPGALSLATSTFISPVVVALCRRRSPRVAAVLGGLLSTLGCLFTSFTTQFHQIFVSWCFVVGIGLGVARETANIVVGSYFKRKRESVELLCLAATGLGVAVLNHFLHHVLGSLGWRHGLQATTGAVSSLFIIGMLYRPASLYHPQRRAIVHLKNQVRPKEAANGIIR